MKLKKVHKQERGVALFLAIFALLLLSAIGLAMLFSSDTETTISVNYRDKQAAIYGALGGLQEARDRIHPLTGDLGRGANLSLGGLNIVPTALPSTSAANVLYIINPAPGETVAPWDYNNKYFDTELCHEPYFANNPDPGVTAGTPGVPCPATSASVPAGTSWYEWYDNSQKKYFTASTSGTGSGDAALLETAYQLTSGSTKVPLTYKWVRITLKSDNMTPVSITGGTGGSAQQVCWDGSHEQLLQNGYHTDCTPPTGGITNINVTASGAGYTSAPIVSISGGGGSGAMAVATCPDPVTGVDKCFGQLPVGITNVTLTNPGAGYTSVPAVTITPTDGYGSGAIVNATLNSTLPVSSVSWTSSPPACYPVGSVPSLAFNPAGATASVTMTGQSCVYSFTVSGKCQDSSSTVTASGGFSGSVTWGSIGHTAKSTSVANPGNYTSSLPGSSNFTVNCVKTVGGSTPAVTPTYGIQINTVNVTNGGAYQAGPAPSATFSGVTTPTGGSPSATATLSGTINPSPVTGLTIPFGGNGSGYDANPTLTIAAPSCTPGPSCVQATGTASISPDKGVLAIKVTNAGSGYSPGFPPTVTIAPPCTPFPACGGLLPTAVPRIGAGGVFDGAVYLLTSLSVTRSGARAMAQMEVGVNYDKFTLGVGGAYTSIGPNPQFGTPNSQIFQMIGNDCPTCGGTPTGCNTTPQNKDAIGVYDPTNAANPSAVQTIINDLGKPNNYIGANSTPDVTNANIGTPSATELDSFVDNIAGMLGANVYGTRAAPVNNPTLTNMGSASNPATNVVYGNYTMGPTTGYGILVVTGTLTISGNYSWNGIVLVIGSGASVMNGGGYGQINGAVIAANTLGGTLNSPNANWSGGGGNGIQYNHCLADYLLSDVPAVPYISPNSMQVVSLRTEVY